MDTSKVRQLRGRAGFGARVYTVPRHEWRLRENRWNIPIRFSVRRVRRRVFIHVLWITIVIQVADGAGQPILLKRNASRNPTRPAP